MKRSWTALAVTFAALFAAAGCNDYGNTFQVPTGATITSLSPADISAGSGDFTLTVNGGPFVKQTVVQWNQQTIVTNVNLDANGNVLGITATVPAALVAKAGTAFVNTLSPHSGAGTNGLSNSLAFIVNPPPNPVPTVSSTSPSCATNGSASFTLTVAGTNFLPASDPSGGSQVRWNAGPTQTPLALVGTATATQIQATVTASLVANVGTAIVTVFNPPSPQSNGGNGGGGTSPNGLTFTIQTAACPAAATAASAQSVVAEETPAVSADGRYVAYTADQNGHAQVLLRDTCEGGPSGCQPDTKLLSVAADGTAGNDDSRSPSMSADGRYVAFSSAAANLLADAPTGRQVYLRDTCIGAAASSCAPSTQLVSTDPQGALTGTEALLPSVSASGRFVAFVAATPSHAANDAWPQTKSAASTPNSGYRQVFVRDTCLGASSCTPKTTRISMQPGDVPPSGAKPAGPALSGSAKQVALSGAGTATLFTHAVAVDDRVFLALTKAQQ
jgi:hypothetical protein